MPQLNRDLLREVFYEIVKENGFKKNIEKFMMAGKEPFKLVLDHCKKANNLDIYGNKIIAKLPGIKYEHEAYEVDEYDSDYGNYLFGTKISAKMVLFKPITVALASTIEYLDIRSFSSALIPMLKFIDWEMTSIYIYCEDLKAICDACSNIPNVRYGVTVKVRKDDKFFDEMKSFTFPCDSLEITDLDFIEFCHGKIDNSFLSTNIHELIIHGNFTKTAAFHQELKEFAAFLSTSFPNLKTLKVHFLCSNVSYTWDWNDDTVARCFQQLPPGIEGCITFEQIVKKDYQIDQNEYPDVQKEDDPMILFMDGEEFYKVFSVTNTLCFKLSSSPQSKMQAMFNEIYAFDMASLIYAAPQPTP